MQKEIFITLVLVLFLGVNNVSCQINDLIRDDLKGKVLSMRETIYQLPDDQNNFGNGNTTSDIVYYYDQSGNRSKTVQYKNGKVFSYTNYVYDNDTVLTEINEYNPDGSLYLAISVECDNNKSITQAKYNRDFQKSYDDNRKSIDVEYDVYYQNLFTKVVYQNDFKGYVTSAIHLTEDSSLAYSYYYRYDYKYNLTEIKYYNNSGKLSWRETRKYNNDSTLKKTNYYESNRIALSSVYEHEFDNINNWVKRVETRTLHDNFFSDGLTDDQFITVRKITYY